MFGDQDPVGVFVLIEEMDELSDFRCTNCEVTVELYPEKSHFWVGRVWHFLRRRVTIFLKQRERRACRKTKFSAATMVVWSVYRLDVDSSEAMWSMKVAHSGLPSSVENCDLNSSKVILTSSSESS